MNPWQKLLHYLYGEDISPLPEGARTRILEALEQLRDVEQTVIRRRFGLPPYGHPETYEAIGRDFALSRERIRQWASSARRHLLFNGDYICGRGPQSSMLRRRKPKPYTPKPQLSEEQYQKLKAWVLAHAPDRWFGTYDLYREDLTLKGLELFQTLTRLRAEGGARRRLYPREYEGWAGYSEVQWFVPRPEEERRK